MRRISEMDHDEIIAYNLRDGGTAVTVFADTQPYRVDKARSFVKGLLGACPPRARIVELGCSAGDISGYFSGLHDVVGVDVVPAAIVAAAERYPAMTLLLSQVESLTPMDCDILVLCEFLEHVIDPEQIVRDWFPKAHFVVIGHPLNDPGGPEPGHIWSYTLDDYRRWYEIGGHREIETHLFSSPFPEMVMGVGKRL